ncbi:type II toxin-antitoxin system RelE/ParE family toxin [Lactobacillus sp. ESL0701]|uniref:type II toxin-antitoxin system RelE/ParE family toxin n=1 Tax=Lactobacillus sp. ESL0701 TaxID=2983217 RepID=UPI0023F6DC78|nr:type II toxin-antitoxin system RelE/ParE family toxin [Lactobacillus sp. ESL0701]MDF7672281.1 type II toxin-antitoxin system RelE/ParE family toxin [Lactobacillus sp. ESL0701]
MKNPEFESYQRPNGHDEFVEWLDKLSIKDQQKLLQVITDTEEQGLLVAQRMNWVKKIGVTRNLYELRSKVGKNIQRALYFHVEDERYVITHGFTKKTQKTPIFEIKHAISLRKEWYEQNEN